MGAYILRRLLLVIPTLFGIMVINFALTQFVPGGPIDQIRARLEGEGDAIQSIAGTEGGGVQDDGAGSSAARGLPPEFLAKLKVEFGFSRVVCAAGFTGTPSLKAAECHEEPIPALERFFIMMGKFLVFDFRDSYFRNISVVDLILEKMPVSITLGLWATLISYMISIPLGIRKAVKDGSRFDVWTSGAVIVGDAIPAFLFAVLLVVLFAGGSFVQWFPLRGLTSEGFDQHGLLLKVFAIL